MWEAATAAADTSNRVVPTCTNTSSTIRLANPPLSTQLICKYTSIGACMHMCIVVYVSTHPNTSCVCLVACIEVTKVKLEQKQKEGIAEARSGRRGPVRAPVTAHTHTHALVVPGGQCCQTAAARPDTQQGKAGGTGRRACPASLLPPQVCTLCASAAMPLVLTVLLPICVVAFALCVCCLVHCRAACGAQGLRGYSVHSWPC